MTSSPMYEQTNTPFKKIDCQSLLKQRGCLSGWLRRPNILKKWKRKFTVLYKGYVYSFKHEIASEPKHFLSLQGYTSVSEVYDKDNSDFWIFKLLHSDPKQTELFAAPSKTDYHKWIKRLDAEIEWTNVPKHDYMNGVLPHRDQSDIQLENMYDDVQSSSKRVTESLQSSPLLSPSSSCQSLTILYDGGSPLEYASCQKGGPKTNRANRPLPPPPIPPQPSKSQTRPKTDSDLYIEQTTSILEGISIDDDDSFEDDEEYYNIIKDVCDYEKPTKDIIRQPVFEYNGLDYEECEIIPYEENENESTGETKTFQANFDGINELQSDDSFAHCRMPNVDFKFCRCRFRIVNDITSPYFYITYY